jgi:hypothetical protein
MSFTELWELCGETPGCYEQGMIINGEVAREIWEKQPEGIFTVSFNSVEYAARLSYRPLWPYETSDSYGYRLRFEPPTAPADYTLTCDLNGPASPILPLDDDRRFWAYSLSGDWGAEIVEEAGQTDAVRVVDIDGSERIYHYDPGIFGQQAIQVYPRTWTRDGRFLLVNILPDGYISTPFVDSIGLQRIDVQEGTVSYIFIGPEGQQFAYSISPDGSQVAYIRQGDSPLRLVVKDIASGEEASAALVDVASPNGTYLRAGSIVWSPDGNSIYLAASFADAAGTPPVGQILRIDVNNLPDMRVIFADDEEILLRKWGYHHDQADICPITADTETNCNDYLDLETGEVQP